MFKYVSILSFNILIKGILIVHNNVYISILIYMENCYRNLEPLTSDQLRSRQSRLIFHIRHVVYTTLYDDNDYYYNDNDID